MEFIAEECSIVNYSDINYIIGLILNFTILQDILKTAYLLYPNFILESKINQ
jgi:hypothetical protein